LWNLTEHKTFFSANEQRRRPGAASAEAAGLRGSEEMLMRLTLSVIKADVGSVGGHTKPSARMMAAVEGEVAKAIAMVC
jgi:Archaeal fructose 1,6-bisphosphatase